MPAQYDAEQLKRRFDLINERLRGVEAQLALLSEKAGVPYSSRGGRASRRRPACRGRQDHGRHQALPGADQRSLRAGPRHRHGPLGIRRSHVPRPPPRRPHRGGDRGRDPRGRLPRGHRRPRRRDHRAARRRAARPPRRPRGPRPLAAPPATCSTSSCASSATTPSSPSAPPAWRSPAPPSAPSSAVSASSTTGPSPPSRRRRSSRPRTRRGTPASSSAGSELRPRAQAAAAPL